MSMTAEISLFLQGINVPFTDRYLISDDKINEAVQISILKVTNDG